MARSAKTVIDNAIADNLWWERLCYGLIIVFVLTGVAAVVAGVVRGDGLMSLSGTGFAALFWPAMRFAINVRRENIRIRKYETALESATTTAEKMAVLGVALGEGKAT